MKIFLPGSISDQFLFCHHAFIARVIAALLKENEVFHSLHLFDQCWFLLQMLLHSFTLYYYLESILLDFIKTYFLELENINYSNMWDRKNRWRPFSRHKFWKATEKLF